MNETTSNTFSVRAIEDIIQIQKIIEDSPNLKDVHLGKDRSNERVVYSVLKHDVYSPENTNNRFNCMINKCDMENSFKCNDKNCKRLEVNGWEGDFGLPKYVNPNVVVIENIGIIEGMSPDPDAKCWSSDSDVTVLRVKKEFRNELSNKVEWEEQRNLTDDASVSSTNLDWESHSLINLAGVVGREKDIKEGLTPFTIWSKANNRTNSSMVLVKNTGSFQMSEPCTPEVRLEVENGTISNEKCLEKVKMLKKEKSRNFFLEFFSCFFKKKKKEKKSLK